MMRVPLLHWWAGLARSVVAAVHKSELGKVDNYFLLLVICIALPVL